MKKNFFLTILCIIFNDLTVFSQLKIDSNGKTIFGTNQIFDTGMSIYDESGSTPFRLFRNNDIMYFSRNDLNSGFKMSNNGTIILGNDFSGSFSSSSCLYFKTLNQIPLMINSSNDNAGYGIVYRGTKAETKALLVQLNGGIKFYVQNDGLVYTTSNYTASDVSLKNNIETILTPIDKIKRLRGVSYQLVDKKDSINKLIDENNKTSNSDNGTLMEKNTISSEIRAQIELEKRRKHMGVIAQEVEMIVPEVVRTMENGTKAVAYNELIGLLIEAIKEQQIQIEELQQVVYLPVNNMSKINDVKLSSPDIQLTVNSSEILAKCKLYQNSPNPFTEITQIHYFLPPNIQNAYIFIFDMSGKLLKSVTISLDEDYIFLNSSELQAGMYLYSLVVNGCEIDTKRMVLTN